MTTPTLKHYKAGYLRTVASQNYCY